MRVTVEGARTVELAAGARYRDRAGHLRALLFEAWDDRTVEQLAVYMVLDGPDAGRVMTCSGRAFAELVRVSQ